MRDGQDAGRTGSLHLWTVHHDNVLSHAPVNLQLEKRITIETRCHLVTGQYSTVCRFREPGRLRRSDNWSNIGMIRLSQPDWWVEGRKGGQVPSYLAEKRQVPKASWEMEYELETTVWGSLGPWQARWGGDPRLRMRVKVSLKHWTLLILKAYLWIFICSIYMFISMWLPGLFDHP